MSTPPNPNDENPQNPVPEAVKPVTNEQQDADNGAAKDASIFVNKEPIREDQVQNAVKFLSHPKVKGSPVMYRRSFLERKGLTKEEIDEAFRRVPDESPSVSTTQTAVANQGGQPQPASNIQPQAPTQSVQPAPAAPGSKLGTLTASRFHWSHALLAVGVLAISGAGTAVVFKNAVVPRLKSWIRKVVNEDVEDDAANKTDKKPTLAEEAAAAAKAAAAAASDVARASQEMLASKTEEKKFYGELLSQLDVQVQEMKSMSNSIRKLEGQSNIQAREVQVTSSRPPSYTNGRADYDSRSARSLSPPPASVEPSANPPHPKSYMEIMSMIQRGERPPNIREIDDRPPNPDQPVSNPRLAPKPKPWEAVQSQGSSTYPPENSNGLNYYGQDNGSGSASGASVYQPNGEGSAPWWQQKNVRITEMDAEESKTGYPGGTSERPVQRPSWTPPQPPPVAMAEAAAAIRQPKKSPFEKEQHLTDEQFLSRSASEATDELQRITKISESGGVAADGGGVADGGGAGSSVVTNTNEIQREEGSYYEV
ncbi:putative peroxisomal membrane protein [Helianthus annuus]|uniref:Peroxisomal membrane protein PEX14 n=1 Tax=Helianthus annuus TaxID=4232 RepID=A0A9K3GWK4_HELAN|nr:peroxisomal membrane protein PEX14 [Helianthus annuus]XP_022017592.1 peroxisomal membrane protein PEX14 [Helianthus annuus]KAF5758577.1 putative peroxisomal membrane protein [Helianthus annuus]KAJ0819847.1 putative peroxisomal membrane protein [Helianthus annuus]